MGFSGKIKSVSVKGITVIGYNHLNLPSTVTRAGDKELYYIYDATGRKLTQIVNDNSVEKKRTDYSGEFIYENDTLKIIQHEEGRIVSQGSDSLIYQYHLKDHLGNVRLTFTTKPETDAPTATVETANVAEEQSQFLNYAQVRKIDSRLFDHTNDGSTHNAVRLMGGQTTEVYGLARSLSVMPGDTLRLEVFAKYLDTNTSNWSAALLNTIAAIAGTPNPGGTFVDGGVIGGINGTFPFPGLLTREEEEESGPKAYLNYILFDRNYNYLTGGFKRVTTAAREYGQGADQAEGIAHERLYFDSIAVEQAGYAYIYFSNENETPVEVFFDDFKVEHIKSPVVQVDDYYPFGLQFNSYSRENSTPNQYLYNGKELQDELSLGWLDYGARMYMPEIGRWAVIDKKAEVYTNLTTYCYAANTPVNAIDPDGNLVVFINGLSKGNGGSRSYWQGNEYVKVGETPSGQRYGETFYRPIYETRRLDFAQTFNDHFGQDMDKARFVDGAPRNDGNADYRIEKGYEKGKEDAAVLIQSLDKTGGVITEPLILATHSLGGAFGRGYLRAIIEYVKAHPEQCKGISISVYDFDPYDANLLSQVSGISITQILHKSKFGLANQVEQGVSEKDGSLIDDTGKSTSHSITSFISSISSLKPGKYVWNGNSFVKVEEKEKKK